MPFDSPDYPLGDLLKDVRSGKIQLPDFQREWKWENDRIGSLLASVSLGYPIGVVMLLEVGDEGIRFAPRAVAGVPTPEKEPELLLLDGQQRLTSMYQALASQRPVDTMDSRGKRLQRWYYIDIAAALDPERDREEAIVSVPEDKILREDFGRGIVADFSSVEKECAAEMFPLSIVYDPAAFFAWHGRYVADRPDRVDRWNEFYEQVIERFVSYKLPAIILHKSTPKEAVCTVFEKVNTGGVPLNVFELLTATFAADNFRLNDDWAERRRRLNAKPVLRSLESTDFLQIVSLLATRQRRLDYRATEDGIAPAVSCKRKDILRLGLNDYREWAEAATQGLEWAAGFLAQEHIFRSDDLPYRTQLVPLAAIRTVLGDAADQHAVRAKLRQWYWCGVLGELYGSTTETRFARDLEQTVPWVMDDAPAPGTVAEATFRSARLLTMRTRNSAAYKGVYALLMQNDCFDWIKHQPMNMAAFFEYKIDIHHIFPKAWCDRHGIDAARRESIVNKTALSFDTNRSIGGRSPAEYVKTLEQKSGLASDKLDDVLRTHVLAPTHLRDADFDGFFGDRSERLLALISEAMGKDAIRDDVVDDPMLFADESEDLEEAPLALVEEGSTGVPA